VIAKENQLGSGDIGG